MRDLSSKLRPVYVALADQSPGPVLAQGYTRLVCGERGAYLEIPHTLINLEQLEVQPGQEYRLTERWTKLAYYAHLRTKVGKRKVYLQYKPVEYADYLAGYYYISADHVLGGPWYEEQSNTYLGDPTA